MKWQWRLITSLVVILQLNLLSLCSVKAGVSFRRFPRNTNGLDQMTFPPVRVHKLDHYVIIDNGLLNVTLSTPEGMVTSIGYKGNKNILEPTNKVTNRGYWDVVWDTPTDTGDKTDLLEGTTYNIVGQDESYVEISFIKTWKSTLKDSMIPLNVDKRFIMLRGCSGFYAYAIFNHEDGWPDLNMYQGRIVFKLRQNMFDYMAISNKRQRIMPTAQDRARGKVLDYPEAVLITNPSNPDLKGEVDDKYQYSANNKDNQVHGWISSDESVGFWMITPSDEFRTGGPLKQDLTSHVGPTTLSMFFSTHYTGTSLAIELRDGEPWKKVFGPVLIYLNSASPNEKAESLWQDAQKQMINEKRSWPYEFPLSEDYPSAKQRGTISGRLLVRDRYINTKLMMASYAFVGLATPGDVGSWQTENKGYQFWTRADAKGKFVIRGVRVGKYNLYAWVPGIVGDYKYNANLDVKQGQVINVGALIYHPPRQGSTMWEIGVPDRSAAEFYVPDPNPILMNRLYVNLTDKYRQYGLWDRYTDIYPDEDLTYTIGISNHQADWFYAHFNRKLGNKTYGPTTWRVRFDLDDVNHDANYTLQIAIASAQEAELQVRVNKPDVTPPHFSTGLIGKDNSIARHGIHGLYQFHSMNIPGSRLVKGTNVFYFTQSRGDGFFRGIMYDYIRLEQPKKQIRR